MGDLVEFLYGITIFASGYTAWRMSHDPASVGQAWLCAIAVGAGTLLSVVRDRAFAAAIEGIVLGVAISEIRRRATASRGRKEPDRVP